MHELSKQCQSLLKKNWAFSFFGLGAGREVHGMTYDDYILGQVGLGV